MSVADQRHQAGADTNNRHCESIHAPSVCCHTCFAADNSTRRLLATDELAVVGCLLDLVSYGAVRMSRAAANAVRDSSDRQGAERRAPSIEADVVHVEDVVPEPRLILDCELVDARAFDAQVGERNLVGAPDADLRLGTILSTEWIDDHAHRNVTDLDEEHLRALVGDSGLERECEIAVGA